MEYSTYAEIKAKVEEDLAIEDENFVTENELMGYCNDGINKVESLIHNLYEDYFLSYFSMPLVTGSSLHDLPSDIYANKIRRIIYDDGSTLYPVKRFREMGKFAGMADYDDGGDQFYKYQIINRNISTPSLKLKLFPTSRETFPAEDAWVSGTTYYSGTSKVYYQEKVYLCTTENSDTVFDSDNWSLVEDAAFRITVWYIRNANKMVDETSICDIPEFSSYVIQYMKIKVYEKEHNEMLALANAELKDIQIEMERALTNMIPDDDTEIQPDLSHYQEML